MVNLARRENSFFLRGLRVSGGHKGKIQNLKSHGEGHLYPARAAVRVSKMREGRCLTNEGINLGEAVRPEWQRRGAEFVDRVTLEAGVERREK